MARLIIGHVTATTAKIWVRGSERYPVGFVRLSGGSRALTRKRLLPAEDGYCGVVRFTGLQPRLRYAVEASFAARLDAPPEERFDFGHCHGMLRTFPKADSRASLCFVFGSCNLHALGPALSPDLPYTRIAEEAREERADFMIHCGDQIYFDVPIARTPTPDAYRAKYIDAWGDSRPARRLLTRLPHYMILDDHEIVDDFSNDMRISGPTPADAYRRAGLKVYREFQYSHSPANHGRDALHYDFAFGRNRFFVMDTRSERYARTRVLIGESQMARLKGWLLANADARKFVVTSVPFIAESRASIDKWSHFSRQREEIIEFLFEHDIGRLVFLCGDKHNSHYARMSVSDGGRHLLLHELMSSPINQVQKSRFGDYVSGLERVTPAGVRYTSRLNRGDFYGAHSNATVVRVTGETVEHRIFRTRSRRPGRKARAFTL